MSKCRSCGAEIIWAKSDKGKWIPVDLNKADNGNLVIDDVDDDSGGRYVTRVHYVPAGEGTHVSHFATCPQAKGWRK